MKRFSCSYLSRFVLPSTTVAMLLFAPALAAADTITSFDMSGSAMNVSGESLNSCASDTTCAFSGTFRVDVTTGTVVSSSVDITFPGLSAFNKLFGSGPYSTSDWTITAGNSSGDGVILSFTTTKTPGSLVGFDGGTISRCCVLVLATGDYLYVGVTGSITPSTTPVPEPSSFVLLTVFVTLGFLGLGVRRRKVAHT